VRTHAVLVIGLQDLLGNSTTQLIEPPGPLSVLDQIQTKAIRNAIARLNQ
jgi:hypothetical protein